jgi:tetratricopeptide (TPR) repeat protein
MKCGTSLLCLPLLLLGLASCNSDPKAQARRYLDNGNKFFAKQKYKEAAIMYKKALSKDLKYSEAYYRLALTDLQLGVPGEAVAMLRRAVGDESYKNNDAVVQLANIYLIASAQDEKQRPQLLEDASELSKKLLQGDPNSYDGHRLAGQIALLKQDPRTAIAELQSADKAKPKQSEVAMALYEALVQDKQGQAAEKLARDFIAQEKSFSPMYDRLYIQYMTEKRFNDAEQILKLKTQSNPKSTAYMLQLATHYILLQRRPEADTVLRQLSDEKQFPDGHLLAGDFYLARLREFDLAKQQYEAGMAAFPKDKVLYQKRLVEMYARSGSMLQASQLVDALLKENPKDNDVVAMHAALLLTSGNRDQVNQAVNDLQGLVGKNPSNHLLKYNYARALLVQASQSASDKNIQNSKTDQARIQLEDAIKIRPDFIAARELLARVYLTKPDLAKALQTAEDLLRIDQRNLAGHLIRSAALLNMGNMDKARQELNVISQLYPQNPDAQYQVGLVAFQDKDYKKAEQVFGALYRENHDNRGLLGITETLSAQNRMDDAIKELDKALAADPNRQDLKLGRANLYVRAQRYDEAIAAYKSMLEKEPNSADLLFRLAETYRRKGDINLAAETFRKCSQVAPNNTLPLLELALILETTGPADQAKAVYEQILKIDPNQAVALNNLAMRKADEGQDLDSALTMAQRAHQMQPNASAMADTLGWIYIKKNLSGEAEQILKDLVKKDPANPTFRYHYGMALIQKGDKLSARRELETALKNKPSKDEVGKIQDLLTKL